LAGDGFKEVLAGLGKVLFEVAGAVAIAAGPGFGAMFVAAIAAGVGIFNFEQVQKLFPIWALLFERSAAEAGFNPLELLIGRKAGGTHVFEVFIARN
jgi:hypothetical protein